MPGVFFSSFGDGVFWPQNQSSRLSGPRKWALLDFGPTSHLRSGPTFTNAWCILRVLLKTGKFGRTGQGDGLHGLDFTGTWQLLDQAADPMPFPFTNAWCILACFRGRGYFCRFGQADALLALVYGTLGSLDA